MKTGSSKRSRGRKDDRAIIQIIIPGELNPEFQGRFPKPLFCETGQRKAPTNRPRALPPADAGTQEPRSDEIRLDIHLMGNAPERFCLRPVQPQNESIRCDMKFVVIRIPVYLNKQFHHIPPIAQELLGLAGQGPRTGIRQMNPEEECASGTPERSAAWRKASLRVTPPRLTQIHGVGLTARLRKCYGFHF